MSGAWKWVGVVLVALVLVIAGAVVLLDGNHLRGTVARMVTEKTGRQLVINGDLQWKLDWPRVRMHALDVTFANPSWAREKQMITAPAVDLSLDLPLFLGGKLSFSDVQLDRPIVFFERDADGRKNWLLDQEQRNEDQSIAIGHLTVDHGRVGYDDPIEKTSIVAEISTAPSASGAAQANADASAATSGVVYKATGKYRGLPLTASGSGGPVLELRDESSPYPVTLVATVGPTTIKAEGTVTSLTKRSALDLSFALRGGSLAELYDLFGMALPETRAYSVAGHLTHGADWWRYEKFSGRIGQSDVAGSLHITSGTPRPVLKGDLAFKALYLADLGPVVGEEPGTRARQVAQRKGALPGVPLGRDRWTSGDADVLLKAQTIIRPKALPLEQLTTRLRMRQSVLTLEPLDFSAAGGHVDGVIRLNGQQKPIQAHAKLEVRKLLLGKVLPTVAQVQNSAGQVNGQIELVGRGDSVANMLATADGKIGLVVDGGKISKKLMQEIAAHVPEMVLQQVTGDELIDIRCGVADFNVEHGVMNVDKLVLDTDVTKVVGKGTVDLAKETMDLTLTPRPKRMSVFAMRGPISVRGDMAHPDLAFDATRASVRGLAALALGAINPALALIPLADPGGGKDSDCAALTARARAPWQKSPPAETSASKPAPQRG